MYATMGLRFLLVLRWLWLGASEMTYLELMVERAYVDKGLVSQSQTQIYGEVVEYLQAGPDSSRQTVLFCHGGAFTAFTWKYVGVLDELAQHEVRAVAINLPGRGMTSPRLATSRHTFLLEFAKVLGLPETLVVVAASMGGSYGLPFVLHPGQFRVAGYVTVAGVLGDLGESVVHTPVLAIYGSDDMRLYNERVFFERSPQFPQSNLVVFENAPHPCYIRNVEAAKRFSELVRIFVGQVYKNTTTVSAT